MGLNLNKLSEQEALNTIANPQILSKTINFDGTGNNGKILTASALSTNLTGDNNDIVYTAATQGLAGDAITIEYYDTGAPGEELAVAVTGTAIKVTLAREAVATAALTTALAGTHNDLVFTARESGTSGNAITVTYVDPSANDATLSVEVSGTDITVNLATNGSGTITSTAAQIRDAINYDAEAQDLVYVTLAAANNGTGVVTALAQTSLTGGTDGNITTTADEIKTAIAGDVDANALVSTADKAANDGSGVVTAMAATALSGGSDGYIDLFTLTEDVNVAAYGVVKEDLAGATATLSVGITGATTALLTSQTATNLDLGETWDSTGIVAAGTKPTATPSYFIQDGTTIRAYVGTASITDGSITFYAVLERAGADSSLGNVTISATGTSSTQVQDTPLATKVTVSGAVTYVAEAAPGTAQATAGWRVKKVDETTGTVITWADGNANFDNVATDLTALTYA